ncbi:hypothetical protein Pcinc_000847 [Petrolisthes cinctipes]|uniref:polynucleotide adenylyltransferase n=1 Tax=Petrolisthes cinctipes TaxID=88211 RepID=A0AAE1GNX8_PETCI|nr:hypothetical protein Pcinc_000847 [Petrolisthes cinctipes]
MEYKGIKIDLLFARLALNEVHDSVDLRDDTVFMNMDEKSVRSLNGFRVTNEILRQVPNREGFRVTLRAIKLWAKLYLKEPNVGKLGFKVWNPQENLKDRFHLMPIVTPAYPQQNSTYNTCHPTLDVMVEEFKAGRWMIDDIMRGEATWDKLFHPSNFFMNYKHFLVVTAEAQTPEDHLEWYGLVESKIRHFICSLGENPAIETVHINPTTFTCSNEEYAQTPHSSWFLGVVFHISEIDNINLNDAFIHFVEVVSLYSTNVFAGTQDNHTTRSHKSR